MDEKIEWKPDAIVLGPGGVRGFLEIGSLYALEVKNLLTDVHHYCAVSVGAIIALLLICGYNTLQITIEATELNLFQELHLVMSDIRNNKGLISNNSIKQRLSRLVEEKLDRIPTLGQLYESTLIKLEIVTLNLDRDQVEYISYENHSDLSCVDAVLLSTNIPLLFHKLKFNGETYVDGALGNPYPIDRCDTGGRVLGISIVSNAQCDDDAGYCFKIMNASMTQLKKRTMANCSDRCRHLELFANFLDVTGITVSAQEKAEMFLKGYRTTLEFIAA